MGKVKTQVQEKAPPQSEAKQATSEPTLQLVGVQHVQASSSSVPPPGESPAAKRSTSMAGQATNPFTAPGRARFSVAMQGSMGNARFGRIQSRQDQGSGQSASLLIQRLAEAGTFVGEADDEYEQEADEVATRVREGSQSGQENVARQMRPRTFQAKSLPDSRIQRLCPDCDEDCECKRKHSVQRKQDSPSAGSTSTDAKAVQDTVESSTPGVPITRPMKSRIESELGEDLSEVQVHDDAASHRAAGVLQARAFTRGDHIHLGDGASADDTALMAHEATHVVQQRNGSGGPQLIQRSGMLDAIGEGLSSVGGTLADIGQAGAEFVGEGLGSLAEMGSDAILSLLRRVSPELADFIERGPFAVIRDTMQEILAGWVTSLTGNVSLSGTVEGIKDWFSTAFVSVRNAVAGDEKSCSSFAAILNGLFNFAKDVIHNPVFEAARASIVKVHDIFTAIVGSIAQTSIESFKFVWDGVKAFAGMLADWIGAARELAGQVWDWVSEQLGLSGSEGGVIDWVKEKANQVWQFIKEEIAPAALQGLTEAGRFLYKFSGLKAFHDMVEFGGQFVDAVQWLWENRNDPDLVTRAAEDPEVKDTILPQVLSVAKNFGDVVKDAVSWVSDQATAFVTQLMGLIGKISGVPVLGLTEGFVSAIRQTTEDLRDWAAEVLPQVASGLCTAVERIWKTVKPIVSVLSLLALGIANPPLLPVVVSGLLGAALWSLLPDCYKPPIINFLLDLAVEVLSAMPDLPLFGPLWSLLRPGIIGFLETVRGRSNEEKIQVTNKIAKIMLWSGIDFIAGFVWGFLKGVWESLTDPFVMLWMLGKGLFNVTDWLARMGERFFGEKEAVVQATAGQTGAVAETAAVSPSDQELGARVVEMANELQPPAVEVRDNFFEAAKEYFSASEGASFASLREKLGEAWDDAQTSMQGQGEQLANRTVDAFLAPNAEEVAAGSAFRVGEFIGWLGGTIVTEVLIAIFSVGTVTAAKGVMKVVTAIAKVIDKIGDIFGVVFRLIGKLGKGLFKLIKGMGTMFAKAGRGAIRVVIDALTTIANKLMKFADEILAKISGRAAREAGEEVAERGTREVAEEIGEEIGERGLREAVEEIGERGARETAEEAGERTAKETGEEATERGGRDAATEAAEKPAAIAEARGVAQAHDAINSPVPVVIGHLMTLKGRYRWIDTFQARAKPVPGHYSLHMIASDSVVRRDYTPGKGPGDVPKTSGKLSSSQLGDRIDKDTGSFKEVYEIKGRSDLVVALEKVPGEGYLEDEVRFLTELEGRGFPVVKNHGIVDVDGRKGILLDKIDGAVSSKAIEFGDVGSLQGVLNSESVGDLKKIREKLISENIHVVDLQFLVRGDGRVFINDPMNIGGGIDQEDLDLIDEMIRLAGA